MPSAEYYLSVSKQRFQIKIYTVLCFVLITVVMFYGFVRLQEYNGLKTIIEESRGLITNLESQAAAEKANYEVVKGDFNLFIANLDRQLENIFPLDENYIVLTKQFDDIEDSFATLTNTFQVSNLAFSSPSKTDTYSILPLRMTATSSLNNFHNFLRLIENSGDFSNETRLMEISSVRLNFPQGANTRTNDIINFTVSINAYFQ